MFENINYCFDERRRDRPNERVTGCIGAAFDHSGGKPIMVKANDGLRVTLSWLHRSVEDSAQIRLATRPFLSISASRYAGALSSFSEAHRRYSRNPVEPGSVHWEPTGRCAHTRRPKGVTKTFQIIGNQVEPLTAKRVVNLLSNEDWRARLAGEPEGFGPEVPLVFKTGSTPCVAGGAERLARAACGPNGPIIMPSRSTQCVGPNPNSREEVDLSKSSKLICSDIGNAPLIHHARRNQPLIDQVAEPLSGIRINFVIEGDHSAALRANVGAGHDSCGVGFARGQLLTSAPVMGIGGAAAGVDGQRLGCDPIGQRRNPCDMQVIADAVQHRSAAQLAYWDEGVTLHRSGLHLRPQRADHIGEIGRGGLDLAEGFRVPVPHRAVGFNAIQPDRDALLPNGPTHRGYAVDFSYAKYSRGARPSWQVQRHAHGKITDAPAHNTAPCSGVAVTYASMARRVSGSASTMARARSTPATGRMQTLMAPFRPFSKIKVSPKESVTLAMTRKAAS